MCRGGPLLSPAICSPAAVALVIAVLVAAGRDSPEILTLLVTVQGAVSAVIGPFQQAILPDLVPPPEFLAAVSLNSAQFNLGRVVGPALAGLTIAAFGYPVAFVANGASFLAVVVALFFVHLSPPPGHADRTGLFVSLRLGARAARAEPGCRAAIGTIAVVALSASPFIALVPVMAHRLTHTGARGIASATALLTTAQGLGAVAGALAVAPLAARFGRGRILIASLAVLPPVLVLYGFAPSLAFALPALFVVGLVYISVLSGFPPSCSSVPERASRARAQPLPGRARSCVSDRFPYSGSSRGLTRLSLDDRRRVLSCAIAFAATSRVLRRDNPCARRPGMVRGATHPRFWLTPRRRFSSTARDRGRPHAWLVVASATAPASRLASALARGQHLGQGRGPARWPG